MYWKAWKRLQTLAEVARGVAKFPEVETVQTTPGKALIYAALARAGIGMGDLQRLFPTFIILWFERVQQRSPRSILSAGVGGCRLSYASRDRGNSAHSRTFPCEIKAGSRGNHDSSRVTSSLWMSTCLQIFQAEFRAHVIINSANWFVDKWFVFLFVCLF